MMKKIIFFAGFLILAASLCSAEVWKAPDQEKIGRASCRARV